MKSKFREIDKHISGLTEIQKHVSVRQRLLASLGCGAGRRGQDTRKPPLDFALKTATKSAMMIQT